MAAGASAQTGYGLKAGVNLPKLQGENTSTDMATNFYLTGYGNIAAGTNFAIQPGVSLQGKGGKVEVAGVTTTTNLLSIEIPVNAVYYVPAGSGSVFLGAGPYVGYNVSGQVKTGDNKADIKFGNEAGQTKPLDYGANFLGGYKLSNGLIINAGYGLGLANLSNISGATSNNRVLSFGIGFEF